MIFFRRALLAALLVLGSASGAAAMFGNDETLHRIDDVGVTGSEGEKLYLGYKTTTLFLGGGVYLKDDGYILGVDDKSDKYYPMPSGEELAGFQERGLIPDPLPSYSVPWFQYLIGYSLWIVLGVMGLWSGFDYLRKRNRPEAKEAT